VLTRLVGSARPGRKTWCCESCRKAALRHEHDAAKLEGNAPARQPAQAGPEYRLSRQAAE